MRRAVLYRAATLVFNSTPLYSQAHPGHRHPSGAKILVRGTVVEPVCHFAGGLSDSALAGCATRRGERDFHPVLLRPDSTLYLLAADGPNAGSILARIRQLVGRSVRVDGTVFAAANGYLIVVDSLRTGKREG